MNKTEHSREQIAEELARGVIKLFDEMSDPTPRKPGAILATNIGNLARQWLKLKEEGR